MRRKSLEMTSNQVKNGLEWGDSMSGAPRAVEKETSRQRRSCARWVFPQPAKAHMEAKVGNLGPANHALHDAFHYSESEVQVAVNKRKSSLRKKYGDLQSLKGE